MSISMVSSAASSSLGQPFIWLIWLFSVSAIVAIILYRANKGRSIDISVEDFGFAYDYQQNIFYSTKDAWQRRFGYCKLYDEASALSSMIIDCEPIYFEYGGKRWLIEFWKGQYGATTGCEVGVYSTILPELNIPGVLEGGFYNSVSDEDLLEMTFTLFKDGKPLFTRNGLHWWLTGFRLGEFSEPGQLVAVYNIKLLNEDMLENFVEALENTGYSQFEYQVIDNAVNLVFDKPHSRQPSTRTESIEKTVQRKNKLLCTSVNLLTEQVIDGTEKLELVKQHDLKLYKQLKNSIRPEEIYKGFKKIDKAIKKTTM